MRLVPVDGFLRVDIRGLVQARGAYICADPACVKEAYRKKGSFSRALKQQVKLPDEAEFILEISSIKRV